MTLWGIFIARRLLDSASPLQIQGDFFTGFLKFQYQKKNLPSCQLRPFLASGFTGKAALIGWLAVFILVLQMGGTSEKITLYLLKIVKRLSWFCSMVDFSTHPPQMVDTQRQNYREENSSRPGEKIERLKKNSCRTKTNHEDDKEEKEKSSRKRLKLSSFSILHTVMMMMTMTMMMVMMTCHWGDWSLTDEDLRRARISLWQQTNITTFCFAQNCQQQSYYDS